MIKVTSPDQQGVEQFWKLTERQLRHGPGEGSFVAESPYVIQRGLENGFEPLALLCEESHADSPVVRQCGDIPVYAGSADVLRQITGYALTRGVICVFKRPVPKTPEEVLTGARRIAVLDGIVDSENIGAIFRSGAALGIDAILLTHSSCDPFNRRCVRVSMGAVFQLPWAWLDGPVQSLGEYGFQTAAMALSDNSISLSELPSSLDRLALVLGNEGDGLPAETIAHSDYVVRIPMHHGVDSLNVAIAGAIAFWQMRI